MASPDTDELQAGGPGRGQDVVGPGAAGVQPTEPLAAAGVREQAEAAAAGAQQTEPLATGAEPPGPVEPAAAKPGAAGARGQGKSVAAGPGAAGVQPTEPLAAADVREQAEAAAAGVQPTEPLATEPLAAEAQTVPQERVEPERIEPADAAAEEPAEPEKPRGRWWRGFTGSLAAGLTVLAIGVLAVAGIGLYTGAPGPGPALLIGHPIAAVLALLAQRVADRRNGAAAAGAGLAVVLFAVAALTLFWLT
ncbi:hypothetical protein [Amycolatopsis sp. MEPSY49]|uniref:hypothetical protein n=1 Tax=Amycolatopsis sp. MEPSY49 TaxID=3151600 RepID=UPI003EF1E1CE